MADWPLTGDARQQKAGIVSNEHTLCASSGTAHVKGAWTEVIASTSFAAAAIIVEHGPLRNANSFLTDLAVGGSGSETVVIANLFQSGGYSLQGINHMLFPISIPAGTRLAARGQSTTTVANYIGVRLLSGDFKTIPGLGRVTTYGANTAASLGTAVDPGTTINTKGAWVELTASSTAPMSWLVLSASHGSNAPTAQIHFLDIGIGAAGSETIIVPDVHLTVRDRVTFPQTLSLPVSIPSGTRIAVRDLSNSALDPGRVLYVVLHGVG